MPESRREPHPRGDGTWRKGPCVWSSLLSLSMNRRQKKLPQIPPSDVFLSPPQSQSNIHHRPANAGGQTTPGEKVSKQAALQRSVENEREKRGAISRRRFEIFRLRSPLPLPYLSTHTITPDPRLPGADLALPDCEATARRELVLERRSETREKGREREKEKKKPFSRPFEKKTSLRMLISPSFLLLLLLALSCLFFSSLILLRKQAIAADPAGDGDLDIDGAPVNNVRFSMFRILI